MAVPEQIGKYLISEVLGQGAMGVVYKGFDPHIHRPVAIKTVHKALLGDSTAPDSIAARFRNEAQAVGRIAHAGVVAIYEFGEDENTAYIAMEFVQGRNLDEVLAGTPLLGEAQLLRIMDQLLSALAAAHEQGVWHRDIKPANLILTASDQVKLTDFGIARIEHAGLTQVSSMIGTPGYMAPEQYMGEGVDHRADLFACGVLLYRLLTGKPAFSGAANVVMYQVLNETPPAPSTLAQRPVMYDAIVARAMAKQPEQRFASAQEMQQALLHLASGVANPVASLMVDSDATTIAPAGYWPRAIEAATPQQVRQFIGTSTPQGSSVALPTGSTKWKPEDLSRIERALASHIGPMARLMVKQAASNCSDMESLATSVSMHIPEPARRQQFLSAATAGSQARPVGATLTSAPGQARPTQLQSAFQPTPTTAAAPVAALTEDFKARAIQVLTKHLGPIARVLIKRAADQSSGDKDRFVRLLVDGVAEKDRAGLLRDMTGLG